MSNCCPDGRCAKCTEQRHTEMTLTLLRHVDRGPLTNYQREQHMASGVRAIIPRPLVFAVRVMLNLPVFGFRCSPTPDGRYRYSIVRVA